MKGIAFELSMKTNMNTDLDILSVTSLQHIILASIPSHQPYDFLSSQMT